MKEIEGFENYCITEEGEVWSKLSKKFLKKSINTKGYYQVKLYGESKKLQTRVHRLVGLNLVPNPLNLPCLNHIDGKKLNNHVSNLEWCTQKQNMEHAWKTGLCFVNENRKIAAAKLCAAKFGANHKDSKKVINRFTGKIHDSIKDASLERGGSRSYLSEALSGKRTNNTIYEYYENKES
jgi:hypothetical protein